MLRILAIYSIILLTTKGLLAQERVGPLHYLAPVDAEGKYWNTQRSAAKATAITLPFFEDFTDDSFFPDTSRWVDRKVYINNNMCVNPISRGVATFDGIDANGLPYEKDIKSTLRYCDSLTSQLIDLSNYSASDSLYLSFFYQPQGNGFDPQADDSLMLYFKRTNSTSNWARVWRVAGSALHPFKQVMIPITDANYFHSEFQIRFVNKASINSSDDHWHVDYIRLDINRSINDTAVNDVAFTTEPTFLLNDYTYMPYHQFIANASGERAAQHQTIIRNNTSNTVNIDYGYTANEIVFGTPLSTASGNVSIAAQGQDVVSFPVYTNTVTAPAKNKPVTFENRYYLQQTPDTGPIANDTIVRRQYFHNYLAYDDGTPEKSYYLNLFSTLPGKIAVEHRLNESDTLKGIAIYFGRQVPLAYHKIFSVAVYKEIAFGGGSDQLLYQEDFLIPNYLQQNSFWYYKFDKPVALPAGKFYLGTIQPALGASDSLYFGLDVHRTTNNHMFYNVLNEWKSSSVSGAVMMRPLFGDFSPSIVSGPINKSMYQWDIVPNPATDKIRFRYDSYDSMAEYTISDLQGRVMMQGNVSNLGYVHIGDLAAGVYVVYFALNGEKSTPRKIVKL